MNMAQNGFSIHKYAAIIAILIVLVMTVLDVTVVNVALPVLAVEFGVSDSYTVWILSLKHITEPTILLTRGVEGVRLT
ncbi:MAG: hypothetical protein K2I35_07035 [Duncaniella sp.]|nr:hypothetical protein [Duncaniella sp.]